LNTSGDESNLEKMGLVPSFSIFIAAAALLFLGTNYLIPYLSDTTRQEPVAFWFLVAGLGIFLPLIITAAVILKKEGCLFKPGFLHRRLRFKAMNAGDWLWCLGALVIIGALSSLLMRGIDFITGGFDHSPPFMSFEPLTPGRYWILALWLPYWVLNIIGEEVLWRGVMLPRQQKALGKWAWAVHGLGWGLFHIAFGWQLLVTLLPILFILPYVVQRRGNTWLGVIIHAAINGPSFIAIAFGLL
jgi:membrane protease YdiL (CAAX protease family)